MLNPKSCSINSVVYEACANSSASGLPQQGVAVVVGAYFLVHSIFTMVYEMITKTYRKIEKSHRGSVCIDSSGCYMHTQVVTLSVVPVAS